MCATHTYRMANAVAAVLLFAIGVMALSTAYADPPATAGLPQTTRADHANNVVTRGQRAAGSCEVIDRPKHTITRCRCTASLPVLSSVDATEVLRLLLPGSQGCRAATLPRK